MYEPWKVAKKDGFANYDHAYTMYKRGVFENDIYTKFIMDLQDKYDEIILKCFEQKGFSERYIREHIDEFRAEVARSDFCESRGYFYKDDLLFVVTTDYKFSDNCDIPNKEEYTIGFRVEMQCSYDTNWEHEVKKL